MFARVRNRAQSTSQHATAPPSRTNPNAPPSALVSSPHTNFDFGLPPAKGTAPPPGQASPPIRSRASFFRPSADSGIARPSTSDGLGSQAKAGSIVGLAPPVLPPIPRVASRLSKVESLESLQLDKSQQVRMREDGDNTSTRSKSSRKSGVYLTNKKSFDHSLGVPPVGQPGSSGGPKKGPESLQSTSTSGGNTPKMGSLPSSGSGNMPKMESSLFPAKESALLPPIDSGPSMMTRAWIDNRDRGYAPPQTRSNHTTQGSDISAEMPWLQSALIQDMRAGRDPTYPIPLAPPVPESSERHSPRPTSAHSLRAPKISGARLSPNASATDLRDQMLMDQGNREDSQRPVLSVQPSSPRPSPSGPPTPATTYSGSTARPSTRSSASTAAASRASPSLSSVIGTPYQETSTSFPLPQHVATRPRTAGTTSTVAGVSIPTHHTHSPRSETSKSEKRKTRLPNPISLLQRRRSGQDEAAIIQERSAQAQAFARQKSVAALGGVKNLPADYDPRIRGKVVHDFSAPRTRRNPSYSDADMYSSDSQFQTASGAPSIPALLEEGLPYDHPQSSHSKQQSESSSSRKSAHSPVFREHLYEMPDTQKRDSSLNAERLENRDFVQRVGGHRPSHSGYSQDSATLPPFARKSQQFATLDPSQAALFRDDESKRSSDLSSGKERNSNLSSSMGSVSPVTARSSGAANVVDSRDSLSPISPASPENGAGAGAGQMSGMIDMSARNVPTSPEPRARSQSELTARPHSDAIEHPLTETIDRIDEHPYAAEQSMFEEPVTNHESAAQGEDFDNVSTPTRGLMRIPIPERDSSLLQTPELSTPELTPEIREAQTLTPFRASQVQPKLVEKRASAAGHSRRSGGLPRHRVSNASRFSFQFGSESAVEEQKLMDKHQRVSSRDLTGAGADEDEDDYFDEDAMDDMDEIEAQEHQQQRQDSTHLQVDNRVQQTQASETHIQHARAHLQPGYNSGEDSASNYDDDDADEKEEVPDVREQTYAEHPDFRLHSAIASSRATSQASWQQPYTGPARDVHQGTSDPSRGQSDPSALMVNTHLPPASAEARINSAGTRTYTPRESPRDWSATEQTVGGTAPSAGMYGSPEANAYFAAGGETAKGAARPVLPHRDSGSSERNRMASGFSFASSSDAGTVNKHQSAMSSSTRASTSSQSERNRVTSQSTMGDSRSSGARTTSTGLGLSGFSDFRFSDSPSPYTNTRPPSDEPSHQADSKRPIHDSDTLPRNADWRDLKPHASPSSLTSLRTTELTPAYLSSPHPSNDVSTPSAPYKGRIGQHVRQRDQTMDQSMYYGKTDSEDHGRDDMYYDDGGFHEQDLNSSRSGGVAAMDEEAFDNDAFLNGAARSQRAITHQRDTSALTIASMSSDGPYPSFAQPNAASKARQRQSQMLLQDLPLQAPADPKWIPQRNPSEDAKRLGLSNRVPPLPVPSGSREAQAQMQSSLQTYHAALAQAANKAAAEGRFLRAPSVSTGAHSRGLDRDDDRSQHSRDDRSYYSRDEDGDATAGVERSVSQQTSNSKQQAQPPSYSLPKLEAFDFGFGHEAIDDFDAANGEADDDIVAAANAEALASDSEGFYGSEFGFYAHARPNSSDNVQAINGGFFGADGDDGLARQKSLKEPNLTPITERSEFSTRSSFVGMPHVVPFAPAAGGGALPRLPVSPIVEHEVASFDELRRLRANAFGGSNGSLRSFENRYSQSPNGSARSSGAALATATTGQAYFVAPGYGTDDSGGSGSNSAMSPTGAHAHTNYSDGGHAESPQRFTFPALPQAQQQQSHDSPRSAASSGHLPFSNNASNNNNDDDLNKDVETTPRPPRLSIKNSPLTPTNPSFIASASADPSSSPSSPSRKAAAARAANKPHSPLTTQSHSRTGSGTDSVTSYVQERDPATRQATWVLERRRRTSEPGGQLELIGREVVQGGWI